MRSYGERSNSIKSQIRADFCPDFCVGFGLPVAEDVEV